MLLRSGIPIGAAATLWVVLLKVDVLMLAFLTDNEEVGLYAAARGWSRAPSSWPGRSTRRCCRGSRSPTGAALARGYMLGLKLLAAGLIPVGAILACFAGPIVDLLYGDEFAGAALPLALLGWTVALYGLQSFSGTLLIGRDSPGILVRIAGVVLIQNIACNLVAIPHVGRRRRGGRGPELVRADGHADDLVRAPGARARSRRSGRSAGRCWPAPRSWPSPSCCRRCRARSSALIAYAAVLAAVEFGLHRDDVRMYLRALPLPSRQRPDAGPVE